MKKFLTISEFARLRGLNINSIRYYEKQGLLYPAWVDPQTKYRYYLPEQLPLLDIIGLCIHLGLPLQEAKQYMDQDGRLDSKSLLEHGQRLMREKISALEIGLETTRCNLRNIEENELYRGRGGIYTRKLEERFFLEEPFKGDWDDLVQKERTTMTLFAKAQAQGLAPVYPIGFLVRGDPVSYSFIVRILRPRKGDSHNLHIPAGEFLCTQAELLPGSDLPALLTECFPMFPVQPAIVTDMMLREIHFGVWLAELQISKI